MKTIASLTVFVHALALAACGGTKTAPTCGADDLDCFMSHLVIRDASGNDVQVTLVNAATVSSLSTATMTSSTAPQLTSVPVSLSFQYGTLIEGTDVLLTDAFTVGFTDPNGCRPILALTLSKNGKRSGHTGCFGGVSDHQTAGDITGRLGFTAEAPDGASFDVETTVISSPDCTSIDDPLQLLTANGTYASGTVAGIPTSVPVTIAPPSSSSDSGSSGSTYWYANWDCKNQAGCLSAMVYNQGSAGPFCSSNACQKWKNGYFAGATCDTQPAHTIYNAPPAGTCQN